MKTDYDKGEIQKIEESLKQMPTEIETKEVYIVWSKVTDEDVRVPFHICELKTTADRLSFQKGKDGQFDVVEPFNLVRIKGTDCWLGPVRVHWPSANDVKLDEKIKKKDLAIKKATDLGLTKEDIEALSVRIRTVDYDG